MSLLRRSRSPGRSARRRAVPLRYVRSTPVSSAVGSLQARRLNEEELKRLTKEQLVQLARHEELPQRSKMNKAQLARSLRRHFRRAAK